MLNINQIDIHEQNPNTRSSNASTQLNTATHAKGRHLPEQQKTRDDNDNRVPPRRVKLSLTDLSKVRSVEELGRDDISKSAQLPILNSIKFELSH